MELAILCPNQEEALDEWLETPLRIEELEEARKKKGNLTTTEYINWLQYQVILSERKTSYYIPYFMRRLNLEAVTVFGYFVNGSGQQYSESFHKKNQPYIRDYLLEMILNKRKLITRFPVDEPLVRSFDEMLDVYDDFNEWITDFSLNEMKKEYEQGLEKEEQKELARYVNESKKNLLLERKERKIIRFKKEIEREERDDYKLNYKKRYKNSRDLYYQFIERAEGNLDILVRYVLSLLNLPKHTSFSYTLVKNYLNGMLRKFLIQYVTYTEGKMYAFEKARYIEMSLYRLLKDGAVISYQPKEYTVWIPHSLQDNLEVLDLCDTYLFHKKEPTL